MTSHTDRIFLLSRVPLKSRANYQCVTTSMQTVGVIALCFLSLADLTVTEMFRKI